MVRRLVDLYAPGDRVDILLAGRWQAGEVVGLAHPGLWVQSGAQRWFVTNRRHIRPTLGPDPPRSATGRR